MDILPQQSSNSSLENTVTGPAGKQSPGLLSVPPEIRDQIYDHLFGALIEAVRPTIPLWANDDFFAVFAVTPSGRIYDYTARVIDAERRMVSVPRRSGLSSLLRTCRTVHREAAPVLYARAVFYVSLLGDEDDDPPGALGWRRMGRRPRKPISGYGLLAATAAAGGSLFVNFLPPKLPAGGETALDVFAIQVEALLGMIGNGRGKLSLFLGPRAPVRWVNEREGSLKIAMERVLAIVEGRLNWTGRVYRSVEGGRGLTRHKLSLEIGRVGENDLSEDRLRVWEDRVGAVYVSRNQLAYEPELAADSDEDMGFAIFD